MHLSMSVEQLAPLGIFATQRGGVSVMSQNPSTHCGVPTFGSPTQASPMAGTFTHVFVAGSQSAPIAQTSMTGLGA
jgi:hypothetical protein